MLKKIHFWKKQKRDIRESFYEDELINRHLSKIGKKINNIESPISGTYLIHDSSEQHLYITKISYNSLNQSASIKIETSRPSGLPSIINDVIQQYGFSEGQHPEHKHINSLMKNPTPNFKKQI